MMFRSVDFPLPDGPSRTTTSPCKTSRSTPRNARTSTSPVVYSLGQALSGEDFPIHDVIFSLASAIPWAAARESSVRSMNFSIFLALGF